MSQHKKIVIAALVALGMFTASGCASPNRQDQTTTGQGQSTAGNNQPATDQGQSPAGNNQPATGQGQSATEQNQNGERLSDQQFVTKAAQGGMAEVQLGQLAAQRAASNDVKQFGQRMVKDHTQANNQLKQLAQQKGITPPQDMGDEHKATMARLSNLSGAEFDREYMNHMVEDHTEDVSLFQREAQQGQDPDLKALAAKTVPTLQEHLQMARSIAGNTTGTSTPNQ